MGVGLIPNLPPPPQKPEDVPKWISLSLLPALFMMYRKIVDRLNVVTMHGPTADKPDADGSGRFYYDTDTDTLYFDDGTWNAI